MEERIQFYFKRRAALQHALSLLSFDRSVTPLSKAVTNQAATMSVLQKELLSLNQDEALIDALKALAEDQEASFEERRMAEEGLKEIQENEGIDPDLLIESRQAILRASSAWPGLKQNNDWDSFLPLLKEVVELKKKSAACKQAPGETLYDAMLREYMPGFTIEMLDAFFEQIQTKLVPLLQRIQNGPKIEEGFLHQPFDPQKQRQYVRDLIGRLGFDFDSGEIFESEHPFTTHFHNHDVRFTNHYHPDNLHAVFSAIHETGHALYEMGIRDEFSRTPLGGGASTVMHEGQSRFYENMLGRNPLFWQNEFPRLKRFFPEAFQSVSTEEFLRAINAVHPQPIRIMADELSYPLHILLRYELEKKIINEDFDLANVPQYWNQRMQKLLHCTGATEAEGALQDMHWASGMFGYFPGYALGSAVAAQLAAALNRSGWLDEQIRNQDYAAIRQRLKEEIHQYGKLYCDQKLLERITQEKFNPQYYVDYLTKKFKGVYDLE